MTVPPCVKEVTVRLARADERRKWDALMFEHHYLRFIQFAGRGLRYVAEYAGQWLALLGWQSGAFKCGPRDQWIGWGIIYVGHISVTHEARRARNYLD